MEKTVCENGFSLVSNYYILVQTNSHFYIISIVVRITKYCDYYAINVAMLMRDQTGETLQ